MTYTADLVQLLSSADTPLLLCREKTVSAFTVVISAPNTES